MPISFAPMADAARLLEIVAACDQNGGDSRQSDCRELDASLAGGGASRLLDIAAAASSSGQKTTPWKRRGLEALQAQAKRTRQMRGLQRRGLVSVAHAAQKSFVNQGGSLQMERFGVRRLAKTHRG